MTDEQQNNVRAVLNSRKFTGAEKFIVLWQLGILGDFKKALIGAITRADTDNLKRLAKGYPDEVAAFIAWSTGNLAGRLREAGLPL